MNPSVHLGVAIAAQGHNSTCMKKIGIEDGELEKIGKANWKKFGGKDYWIVVRSSKQPVSIRVAMKRRVEFH